MDNIIEFKRGIQRMNYKYYMVCIMALTQEWVLEKLFP